MNVGHAGRAAPKRVVLRRPVVDKAAPGRAMRGRAVKALTDLLGQVSAIRLREIALTQGSENGAAGIVAQIDVLHRSRTLICAVASGHSSRQLRPTLEELCHGAGQGQATPVLIAPRISPLVQAICKQNRISYLDFDGNARLDLEEVFIGKRMFPHRCGKADPLVSA